MSVKAPGHPFKPVTATLFSQGYYLRKLFPAGSAINLKRRRQIFRSRAQEFFLCPRSHQFDSSRVAIHKHARLRIKQPDGIGAALEQELKHGGIVVE